MSGRGTLLALALLGTALGAAAPAASADSPAPAWTLQALAAPTHFKPGEASGLDLYEIFLTNSGAATTNLDPITITDTLPPGLGVQKVQFQTQRHIFGPGFCKTKTVAEVSTVTCTLEEGLPEEKEPAKFLPSEQALLQIHVTVPDGEDPVALTNLVEVQGGGAEPVAAESNNEIDPLCKVIRECAPAGFQEFRSTLSGRDGHDVSAAASHPYQYTTGFVVNLNPSPPGSELPFVPAGGDLKEIEVGLPPGFIANPTAIGHCTAQQFNTVQGESDGKGGNFTQNECPDDSAVGLAIVQQFEGSGKVGGQVPIYNMVAPPGMPAQLAFQPALGLPVYIDTAVRSGPEGLTVHAFVRNIQETKRVTASQVTIWGTPADPLHNSVRGQCAQAGGTCPPGIGVKPFVRLPSSCRDPLLWSASLETWAQPGVKVPAGAGEAAPSGCALPDFSPTIEAQPTTSLADSPSGLHFDLHLPQEAHQDPAGLGEADLRDATVTLAPGLVANPAQADGLAACSPAQIGLQSAAGATPIEFDEAPAACPTAAKIGKVEVKTPLLGHSLPGAVYLAQQEKNPFGSLLALYIDIEDPQTGVVVKLAAKVVPDPLTGQLTTIVTDGPQVPFEDFRFDFFAGARASLRTPPACGRHTTTTLMRPWSAPEGASAVPSNSFAITAGPAGPCPSGALEPKLAAGLANPTAATYSPFHLRLTRADATGEFARLNTTTPSGLVAKLAGVPYCPQAGIDQAASRSHPGQGATEVASPSCPAASQVGTTSAGAGAGPTPFYTGGKVYLAGPYKGAPLSLVAIVPALAGPFDLGVVTNRIALQLDPETAQVSAQSDPLPTILSGIPLDLRDIRVALDRPNFTLAPTNCEPKSIAATVFGPSGAGAGASDRFQVGGCDALGFKPGLSLKLSGGTKRAAHPALKAVVSYPKGAYANIASASVALPHSEFLDQAHIRTICTRVQFAAKACPAGSIYGKARATSPLLDAPLEGPVYLRSSSHPLPDLVLALHGQVDVVAVGRVDSHKGGIRATFDAVPDAPVSKFVLEMQGGKKGLLVNSRNLCSQANRATVQFTGQNAKTRDFRPLLRDSCKAPKPGRRGRG
jgi:hypothetical protein